MSEHLLYRRQIRASHNQMRSARVAQSVELQIPDASGGDDAIPYTLDRQISIAVMVEDVIAVEPPRMFSEVAGQ